MQLMTKQNLAEHFGVSVRTISNWIKKPDFPEGSHINLKQKVYDLDSVKTWLNKEGK